MLLNVTKLAAVSREATKAVPTLLPRFDSRVGYNCRRHQHTPDNCLKKSSLSQVNMWLLRVSYFPVLLWRCRIRHFGRLKKLILVLHSRVTRKSTRFVKT